MKDPLELLVEYTCKANEEGVYSYLEERGLPDSEDLYIDSLNYLSETGPDAVEEYIRETHPDFDMILGMEKGRMSSFLPDTTPKTPLAPKQEGFKISVTDALLGVAVIALIVILSKI